MRDTKNINIPNYLYLTGIKKCEMFIIDTWIRYTHIHNTNPTLMLMQCISTLKSILYIYCILCILILLYITLGCLGKLWVVKYNLCWNFVALTILWSRCGAPWARIWYNVFTFVFPYNHHMHVKPLTCTLHDKICASNPNCLSPNIQSSQQFHDHFNNEPLCHNSNDLENYQANVACNFKCSHTSKG